MQDPSRFDSAEEWSRRIEAVGPASMLVVIGWRMSDALKKRMAPEDIWQETLLHAWRDRARFEWRGIKSFRVWLLKIIQRRIFDAADREGALKRGAQYVHVSLSPTAGNGGARDDPHPGPISSTTPSQVAMHREQAAAMQAALDALEPEIRDVLRLRLFEEHTVEETAERLGIGVSAVYHRFRKGSAIYYRRLSLELASRSHPEGNQR